MWMGAVLFLLLFTLHETYSYKRRFSRLHLLYSFSENFKL